MVLGARQGPDVVGETDSRRPKKPVPNTTWLLHACPMSSADPPGAPLRLAPASPSPGTSGPCSPLQRAFISLAFPGLGGQGQASSLLTCLLSSSPPHYLPLLLLGQLPPWVPAPCLSHSNPVHPHCAGLVLLDHLPSIFKFKHSNALNCMYKCSAFRVLFKHFKCQTEKAHHCVISSLLLP